MKVMKYFAVASLALFAACNNEENLVVPEGANQPVDVMMSVALPGPGTRAAMGDLQNTANNGDPATVEKLHVYLLKGDDIVFLRKIVKGGADRSYGIQVAKLAGVPETVITRAREISEELSDADITTRVRQMSVQGQETKGKEKSQKLDVVDMAQISLFDTASDHDVIEELKSMDISRMTPMDAMNTLYQLQNKLNNRW